MPDTEAAEPADKLIIIGEPDEELAVIGMEVKSFKGFVVGKAPTVIV